MKRLLFLALVSVLVLAPLATATSLNFQNPGDQDAIIISGSCTNTGWIASTTGGNNYWGFNCWNSQSSTIQLATPTQMSYSSGKLVYSTGYFVNVRVRLYDVNNNVVQTQDFPGNEDASEASPHLYEVKMDGGYPKYFKDGVLRYTGAALLQNPYNVGWGTEEQNVANAEVQYWDHLVWGQTENKYVFGLPESDNDAFIIRDDVKNVASNGLWNTTSGTSASSTYMYGQWSRGNSSVDTPVVLDNETIEFKNYFTNVVYERFYTGTAYSGQVAINLEDLIAAHAPDGYYVLTISGSGATSNLIKKESVGATVNWDSKTYSVGDSGKAAYYVLDGGYWGIAGASYKMCVVDAYGDFKKNTTILTQTGTVTQDWTSEYTEGVYYAWLILTDSGGRDWLLGSDYTTLQANFRFEGYVNADQTALPVLNATMNWTQGTQMDNVTTNATGYYETAAVWLSGATIGSNVSATGFNTYWYNTTTLDGSTKFVNITIEMNPHNYTGVALGGTDRENLYKRPISSAYIRVFNTTYSEEWTGMQTNNAGFYWLDAATSPPESTLVPGSAGGAAEGFSDAGTAATLPPHVTATLTNGRLYCVEAYKIGYTNSTTCRVVTGA